MVKECKIYQNKGSPEKSSHLRFDQSICLGGGGDLAVYENLSRGMIALGTD